MFKLKSDTIQFWIMVTGFVGILGAFSGWGLAHFASAESVVAVSKSVTVVSKRVDDEVEERRELKGEVDGLYLKMIPQSQQIIIRHPGRSK